MSTPGADPRLAFLAGGGEMGGRMRSYDWRSTPLGDPAAWPQGLKTLVGLMLASPQPMFIAWGEAQTWLYNDAFVPIMGEKHPHRLGLAALDQVWSEARAVLGPMFARVFAGEPVHMQDFALTLDRHGRPEEAHFAFSYTPVRDDEGRVAGLFGACIEITDRVRADRRKDAFLATLAHELRNPLAPIRQAVRIAKSSNASAEQRAWSHDVIERQSAHMALLLDDLLDMSRVSRGQLQLRRAAVDLAAVVDSAIETARPLIDGRRHRLELSMPGRALMLDADGLRLAQVVSNLLTNAAKYTDPGGRIELHVREDGDALVMQVRDSGMGIDGEMLPRLFQMFSQARNALERSEGGLGIGLALIKGLVELHGGTVEAHSSGAGQGSVFTVSLPGVVLAGDAEPTLELAPGASASQRRILVADDNFDAGEGLRLLLELDGHDVRLVHDGEQAVQALIVAAPDIAFLDIGMPNLNGYDAARRIRTLPTGQAVKLVALTGWGQPADRERAMQAGFDVHLTKPVNYESVRALLQQL